MSLISLPLEILILILHLVGMDEFRSQLGLLTLSKAWYHVVQPLILESLAFSAASLQGFVYSAYPSIRRRSELLKNHVRAVAIDITNIRGQRKYPRPGEEMNHILFDDWCSEMGRVLRDFNPLLNNLTALRSFSLVVFHNRQPEHFDSGYAYWQTWLNSSAISQLLMHLPAQTLTNLKIDLCHSTINPRRKGTHICHAIAVRLPTLHHLYLRLDSICSHAFSVAKRGPKLPLKSLIVNLSLADCHHYQHTRPCGPPQGPYNYRFIKSPMYNVIKRAAGLDIVGIIFHTTTGNQAIDLMVFDCLTRKKLRLVSPAEESRFWLSKEDDKGFEWDGQGEEVGFEGDKGDNVMFRESL